MTRWAGRQNFKYLTRTAIQIADRTQRNPIKSIETCIYTLVAYWAACSGVGRWVSFLENSYPSFDEDSDKSRDVKDGPSLEADNIAS